MVHGMSVPTAQWDWSHTYLEIFQRVMLFLYLEDSKTPDPSERAQSSNEALLDMRFASSRADNSGCTGQEVAAQDLPEDESIISGSPQPEPEWGACDRFARDRRTRGGSISGIISSEERK